jgi:hypothetical protein
MKRLAPHLYFLCFALAPLLSLYALNRAEVQLLELLRPLALVLTGSVLLFGVFFLLSRARLSRAALALSVLLLGFSSFSLVAAPLDEVVRFSCALILPPVLDLNINVRQVGSWCLLMLIALALVLWARYPAEKTILPGWVIGGGYLAPALYAFLVPAHTTPFPTSLPAPQAARPTPRTVKTPDLYCIVLDAYGRQDQLQALFGLDNTPFLTALEQRGFKVLRKSHSNYIQTVLCVSSLLNLDYLPVNPDVQGLEQVTVWIRNNRLSTLLRARGYQIVNIPSDFSPVELSTADIHLRKTIAHSGDRSPFERLLLARTPFASTLYDDHPAYDRHRAQIVASLAQLPDAARIPGPKFVFAHVLAPHPPFVLNAQGAAIYPAKTQFSIGDASDFGKGSEALYRVGYTQQVQGLNTKVLEALDALQKASTRPAVIVVLGDHGSRMQTDWKSRERTNLNEAFSNLQAVYVPGGAPYLTDDLTPINTFRLLLTQVYGESLPRLPDKSFYSPLQNPLKFEEVTAKLQLISAD